MVVRIEEQVRMVEVHTVVEDDTVEGLRTWVLRIWVPRTLEPHTWVPRTWVPRIGVPGTEVWVQVDTEGQVDTVGVCIGVWGPRIEVWGPRIEEPHTLAHT